MVRRLRRRGYPVLFTHEPGGTPLGESMRRLLKGHNDLSFLSELLLFTAARVQLVQNVIQPCLEQGDSVVCDRFTASTIAYQGYGRGLDLGLIEQLNHSATGGLHPDLTVWLDLPVEVSMARKDQTSGDTFDGAPRQFHQKVREGYAVQAAQHPERWFVLDATRDRRALAREIWTKVQPLL